MPSDESDESKSRTKADSAGPLGREPQDIVEVRCPTCNEKIDVSREQAERDFKAKCPNGHEVPLVKAL